MHPFSPIPPANDNARTRISPLLAPSSRGPVTSAEVVDDSTPPARRRLAMAPREERP